MTRLTIQAVVPTTTSCPIAIAGTVVGGASGNVSGAPHATSSMPQTLMCASIARMRCNRIDTSQAAAGQRTNDAGRAVFAPESAISWDAFLIGTRPAYNG